MRFLQSSVWENNLRMRFLQNEIPYALRTIHVKN